MDDLLVIHFHFYNMGGIKLVFANIKDYESYEELHVNFKKAFEFLKREDLKSLLPRKYEIYGEDVFALVQQYETKDLENAMYEAHQKFIDIQYMLESCENMEYFPVVYCFGIPLYLQLQISL